MEQIIQDTAQKMEKRLSSFDKDLTRVRTGRASVTMLDGIRIDYYGNPTPVNQVASLSTPDARTIVITPFEKQMITEIERAIQKADLGVNPTNDGNLIRIPIPQLTEDRRKEIARSIKKMGEEVKVSIRHMRRDANDAVKVAEKKEGLSEDDSKKLLQTIQKETDKFIKQVDDRISKKEKEVMSI